MSEDLLVQFMLEAAAEYVLPLISSISLRFHKYDCLNFVEKLWYGRSWPLSDENLKGEN
jgi:hypothetical protein